MSVPFTRYAHHDLPPLLRESARLTLESPAIPSFSQTKLIDQPRGPEASAPAFFDQIDLEEALDVYSVVRSLAPANTMEIGFCCGGSGLAILQGLEDAGQGMHHAIDPFQSSYARGQGRYNVRAAQLDHRLKFFECFPEQAISELPRVQFCFIDASHLFDLSLLDFVLTDKRLDPGGVVALHDLWMPSLQKLARYILTNRGYEILRFNKSRVPRGPRFRVTQAWGKLIGAIPPLSRFLSPEVVQPWRLFEAPNLLFLRKLKNDDRDWRFHQPF